MLLQEAMLQIKPGSLCNFVYHTCCEVQSREQTVCEPDCRVAVSCFRGSWLLLELEGFKDM